MGLVLETYKISNATLILTLGAALRDRSLLTHREAILRRAGDHWDDIVPLTVVEEEAIALLAAASDDEGPECP